MNAKLFFQMSVIVLVSNITFGQHDETWIQYKTRMEQDRKAQNAKRTNLEKVGTAKSRVKRNIGFPTGSTFTINPVLCIPVINVGDVTGFLEIELPFKIKLPNTTQYTHSFFARANEDRSSMFNTIIKAIDRLGLDGRACLMRAICEVAEAPLTNDGLLGEILNIVLSVTSSSFSDPEMKEFSEAEFYGRAYGDCWSMYPKCPVSLFRLIRN